MLCMPRPNERIATHLMIDAPVSIALSVTSQDPLCTPPVLGLTEICTDGPSGSFVGRAVLSCSFGCSSPAPVAWTPEGIYAHTKMPRYSRMASNTEAQASGTSSEMRVASASPLSLTRSGTTVDSPQSKLNTSSWESRGSKPLRPAAPRKLSKEEIKQSREVGTTILRVLDLSNVPQQAADGPTVVQHSLSSAPSLQEWLRYLVQAERRRARVRESSGRGRAKGGMMSTLAEVSETASAA